MLNIIIVEDEPLFAVTLKNLIELNPCYVVTGIAEDCTAAVEAANRRPPDLALVDLQLARGSSGFSVAARFRDLGIPCLFTSGKAPTFPIPDLALGCLVKPFGEEDLVRALKTAEDLVRGRERLRPSRPGKLWLYAPVADAPAGRRPAPPPERAGPPPRWRERLRFWAPAGPDRRTG